MEFVKCILSWCIFVFYFSVCWGNGFTPSSICVGRCASKDLPCNKTLEDTNCGKDSQCCMDNFESATEQEFDFSTIPDPDVEEWIAMTDSPMVEEVNEVVTNYLEEDRVTSTLAKSLFDDSLQQTRTHFQTKCPGVCIPREHVQFCRYIIKTDYLCDREEICCSTKAGSMEVQSNYGNSISQELFMVENECPGRCVHPSFAIFCDKIFPEFFCPMNSKCCSLSADVQLPVEAGIECTGECLPRESIHSCLPPFRIVLGTNCVDSACCMHEEKSRHVIDLTNSEMKDVPYKTASGSLASDGSGQIYYVYQNGQFMPLQKLNYDESLNPNYVYYADIETEVGTVSLLRDSKGVLYQLPPGSKPLNSKPNTKDYVYESSNDGVKNSVVSIPNDIDDMEENLKDLILSEEGEDTLASDYLPPGEKTMVKPVCPGNCISSVLRFTCGKNLTIYDGFTCHGRTICCVSVDAIKKHELYLKSLSPFFRTSIFTQDKNCGVKRDTELHSRAFSIEDWCWQAAIINGQNQYICGGAIIDYSWVVTAAHCVTGALRQDQEIYVRAGVTDLTNAADNTLGQTRRALSIYVHHDHNSMSLDNDIALLRLQTNFELNSNVCIVCLPSERMSPEDTICTATGYGFVSRGGTMSLRLHESKVQIVDDLDCIANVTDALTSVFILPASSFCAKQYGNYSCQGDAGGPLVCDNGGRYELNGLVSWGLGCGKKDVPSIYVKIPVFVGWINQIISASAFLKALS